MRVLITGGSGVIGSKLAATFSNVGHEVTYTHLSNNHPIGGCKALRLDVSDRQSTIRLFESVSPDVVIHASALTNVDLCETNPELADRINVVGTNNVVGACKKIGSIMTYISTSAVFDGSKDSVDEKDRTTPVNYYGVTKLAGEKAVEQSGLDYLILRTDQPYCWSEAWQKKNTVIKVLEKLDAGDTVKEIVDWRNNPTYVWNFADVALKLIALRKQGIYHLVGSDYISRFEWAVKIAEYVGKDKGLVEPLNSSDLMLPAKRASANLSNKKVTKEVGARLLGVDDGLHAMLQQRRL